MPIAEAPRALPEPEAEVVARRLLHYVRPRQLQLVLRMHELGTIQKAAAAMGMSQPSATQALTQVESLLGVALFDRHARGVRPTREGVLLMPTMQRVLSTIEALAQDATTVQQGASGLVRVAGISAATTAIAATALPALCASQPDLWIEYREVDAAQIPTLCSSDEVDLVLCRSSTHLSEAYAFLPLLVDRLGVYCAGTHPLARRRHLTLQACRDAVWLPPPPGSPPHTAFMQWCGQQAFTPQLTRVSRRSLPLSLALVSRLQCLYVGLESHLGALVASDQLHRLPLTVPYTVDALGLLHPRREHSPAATRIVRHLTAWFA